MNDGATLVREKHRSGVVVAAHSDDRREFLQPQINSSSPMSPAWMIWLTPANNSKTRSSSLPCVSEMTPMSAAETPITNQFWKRSCASCYEEDGDGRIENQVARTFWSR